MKKLIALFLIDLILILPILIPAQYVSFFSTDLFTNFLYSQGIVILLLVDILIMKEVLDKLIKWGLKNGKETNF